MSAQRHQCDDLAVVEKQCQRPFTGDEPTTRLAILVDRHHLVRRTQTLAGHFGPVWRLFQVRRGVARRLDPVHGPSASRVIHVAEDHRRFVQIEVVAARLDVHRRHDRTLQRLVVTGIAAHHATQIDAVLLAET